MTAPVIGGLFVYRLLSRGKGRQRATRPAIRPIPLTEEA
jgi:hypothetical protein